MERTLEGQVLSVFTFIIAKVQFTESTQVYNQSNLLSAYESEIHYLDSAIVDITLDEDDILIILLASTFVVDNSVIERISCPSALQPVFSVQLESTLTASHILYD